MREARVSILNVNTGQGCDYDSQKNLAAVKERIEKVGIDRPDIILIAEEFANFGDGGTREAVEAAAQTPEGPIGEELSALASRFHTYIAFGLIRKAGDLVYNSLVLLDRDGKYVWAYDKTSPMIEEIRDSGITPGINLQPFKCDFGSIAGVICFDINMMELAERYSRQNVDLVLFSSAFPGGRLIDLWSIRYGFNIATSTWYDNNRVLDCTGAVVARTSGILPYATAVLNLNRKVVHMDGNLDKLDKMRNNYPGDIIIQDMREEALCVITSLKKGLEVTDLIREYKVETLPAYLDRARLVREECGGIPCPRWSI